MKCQTSRMKPTRASSGRRRQASLRSHGVGDEPSTLSMRHRVHNDTRASSRPSHMTMYLMTVGFDVYRLSISMSTFRPAATAAAASPSAGREV